MEIDTAGASHNCQHSSRHRVTKGEKRLKVKAGRGHDHYCLGCALESIDRDIERLRTLRTKILGQSD